MLIELCSHFSHNTDADVVNSTVSSISNGSGVSDPSSDKTTRGTDQEPSSPAKVQTGSESGSEPPSEHSEGATLSTAASLTGQTSHAGQSPSQAVNEEVGLGNMPAYRNYFGKNRSVSASAEITGGNCLVPRL